MFLPDSPIFDLILRGILLGPLTLIWITMTARVIGLRTFSKMTAYDFVATVGTGSLLAQAAGAGNWPDFFQAGLAVSVILAAQRGIASIRFRNNGFRNAIENEPALLVSHGKFHRSAMADTRVSEVDIWAKLRQANVSNLDEVEAVILETTGDISVIHGSTIRGDILDTVNGGNDYFKIKPEDA